MGNNRTKTVLLSITLFVATAFVLGVLSYFIERSTGAAWAPYAILCVFGVSAALIGYEFLRRYRNQSGGGRGNT